MNYIPSTIERDFAFTHWGESVEVFPLNRGAEEWLGHAHDWMGDSLTVKRDNFPELLDRIKRNKFVTN